MNPLPFVVSNTSLGEVFGAVLQLHCWDCYRGAVNLAIGPVLPVSHRRSLLRRIHCVHRQLEPFSLASSFNNSCEDQRQHPQIPFVASRTLSRAPRLV